MIILKGENIAIIKSLLDVHTMGINAVKYILEECGCKVIISPESVSKAFDNIESDEQQNIILKWLKQNNVKHIGISYRLDPSNAKNLFGRFFHLLQVNDFIGAEKQIKNVYFSGLKPVCDYIKAEYGDRVITFCGGEAAEEVLLAMGVPHYSIAKSIINGCKYDKELESFGKKIIASEEYKKIKAIPNSYREYGTKEDSLEKRLLHRLLYKLPVIRAHSGPYDADLTRRECIDKYLIWCKQLSQSGYLDILSVGASQLSQSNFGSSWNNMVNGGGVPVNSSTEYWEIWQAARPMLVRTYSGTTNILRMAEMYDQTINMAWHALSLWWFNQLDGRGPNTLYDNLKEHIATIKYIAAKGKPFEANVSHHFAFRGCDDITYIVSAYLSAKLAKKNGIRIFILQNMLNTPRSTWGIQDLAKSRALLNLIKELQDDSFRVVLQTRAGLDYLKPDIEEAKGQLASVTAMMDDIEPNNCYSPEIIHIVSYSEALFLATPDIIDDSIKITLASLLKYRERKQRGDVQNTFTEDILSRTEKLEISARSIILEMENNICNLYSPEGFYIAFAAGWLPVPDLWNKSSEFAMARNWQTIISNGGKYLADKGKIMSNESKIERCCMNNKNAIYNLHEIYGVNV